MPSRRLLLLVLAFCGCATSQPLPPGNELEDPQAPSDSASGHAPVAPGKDPDADLASAFDEPTATPAAHKPLEHNVGAAPDDGPDPLREVQDKFDAKLNEVRQLVSGRAFDQASAALPELESLAAPAGPPAIQRTRQLEVELASASKDSKRLVRAAEKWLLACGPEGTDSCRRQAMAALGQEHGQQEKVAQLKKHDECLKSAESAARSGAGKPPKCLESAAGAYRQARDRLMLARVELVKAQGAANEHKDDASALFEQAERACQEPRCRDVRRRALQKLSELALKDDPQGAARAALRECALASEALPAERRRYARTAQVDRACAAFDAKSGAGACRKLEKSLLGHYVFKDFSKDQLDGEGLPGDVVNEVNQHYAVLIDECLAQQAARMKPPDADRFEVQWVVTNDGRVDQVHMKKTFLDQGPLAQCLRGQFAVWRYPRYKGELQHVEQSFLVEARELHTWGVR